MIHLTLILVDFLSGLVVAGLWAIGAVAGAIIAAIAVAIFGASLYRRWRRR